MSDNPAVDPPSASENMKVAMRQALEANGQLNKIKAQLRAVIFDALENSKGEASPRPQPSAETILVHEMIREYLRFAGLEHTLAVLECEASLPKHPLPRSLLASELGCPGTPQAVPLLYAIVAEGRRAK